MKKSSISISIAIVLGVFLLSTSFLQVHKKEAPLAKEKKYAETPPTAAPEHLSRPFFPRNPHFPALRSGHRLFQRPPTESNFLAVP